MCAKRRLGSALASALSDQSLCCLHEALRKLLRVESIISVNLYYNLYGPRQANLVLIAYASSEGSGEPAHPRSLARTSAARSYKQ